MPGRRISETRLAIRDSIAGQAMGAIFERQIMGGLLALIVLALGGSAFHVGLIATANLLAQATRIFISPYVDVMRCQRLMFRSVLAGAGMAAVFPLLILFAPGLDPELAMWVLLAVFAVRRVIAHLGGSAWMPLLCQILPANLRGRYFGRMRMTWQVSATIVVLVSGWYLGEHPELWQYAAVLTVGVVFSFGRVVMIARLPDPPPSREGPPELLGKNLSRPLRDRDFIRFIIYSGIVMALFVAGGAFTVPYLKTTLELPTSTVIYIQACTGLGSSVSLLLWGKLADKWGNRLTTLAALTFSAAGMLVLALMPRYPDSPVIALAGGGVALTLLGIGAAGVGIANTVRLLHAAPDEHRGPYIGVWSTGIALTAAAATFLAGFVLDTLPTELTVCHVPVPSMRIHFAIVFGLILLAAPALRYVRPLQEQSMRETIGLLVARLPGPLALPLIPLNLYFRVGAADRLRLGRRKA